MRYLGGLLSFVSFFGASSGFAAEIDSCEKIRMTHESLDAGVKCKTHNQTVYERVVYASEDGIERKGWIGPDRVLWLDEIFPMQMHDGPSDLNGMIITSPARTVCQDIGADLPTRANVLRGERNEFWEVVLPNGIVYDDEERYIFWVSNWGLPHNPEGRGGHGMYYFARRPTKMGFFGRIPAVKSNFWVGHDMDCHHSNRGETSCRYIGYPVRCVVPSH